MVNCKQPNMSLTRSQIDKIEAKAQEALDAIYDSSITILVDLNSLISYYNITLKVGIFKDSDIAGVYKRSEKTIYVSDSVSYARIAFTIAHEIGHHVLHQEKQDDVFYKTDADLKQHPNTNDEIEANCFAAALLMPKSKVIELWAKSKDIEQLSKIFGVSEVAMSIRLKGLGLNI